MTLKVFLTYMITTYKRDWEFWRFKDICDDSMFKQINIYKNLNQIIKDTIIFKKVIIYQFEYIYEYLDNLKNILKIQNYITKNSFKHPIIYIL